LERACQEEPGSGLTVSALLSDISAPAFTNGVWPPLRPVSVTQKKPTSDHVVLHCPIHRPPHVMHSLTNLDDETNRMAQHLPRDLPRPSSGLQELVEAVKNMITNGAFATEAVSTPM